jgi:parallel beta-helix repeat protein
VKRSHGLTAVAATAGLVMLPASAAWAATPTTLYVDNRSSACSDTGAGTSSAPFCTIGAAARIAVGGQKVQVRPGTYEESVTVAHSGSAGAAIVFRGARGAKVTGGQNGFLIKGKSYVTVQGFAITGTIGSGIQVSDSSYVKLVSNKVSYAGRPASGAIARGITLNAVSHSVVRGNVTHHNSDDGIGVTNQSTGNQVERNESYANARQYTRAAAGIRVSGSPGNRVWSNRLHDNEDSGIDLWNGSTDSLAYDNVIWHNGDHGIDVHSTNGSRVLANTVYRNYDSGIEMTGSLNTVLANNISADNGIDSARTSGQLRADAASAPSTAANYDLLWLSVPTSSSTDFLDWGGTTYPDLASFRAATGKEPHGVSASPRFADAAGYDLHLTQGSPAIDSARGSVRGQPRRDADGKGRVDDPDVPNTGVGTPPYADRGAYELR